MKVAYRTTNNCLSLLVNGLIIHIAIMTLKLRELIVWNKKNPHEAVWINDKINNNFIKLTTIYNYKYCIYFIQTFPTQNEPPSDFQSIVH